MELINILQILRRWFWLIISVVVVAALGLTLWSNSAERVYEAQVKLQMSAPQQEDVAAFDQYRSINLRDEITVARNNFIEVVQDDEVHNRMVSRHDLEDDDAVYDLELVSERDTDFINIIVKARTPQLAALIVNTLVDEAITYSGELRAKPTNAEKSLYADQLSTARDEFRAAEDAFSNYKAQNGIASLEGEIAISQTLLEQLKLAYDQRVLDNVPNQNDLFGQIDKLIAQHQAELDRLIALQPMYSILEENAQQAREEYRRTMNELVSTLQKETAEEEYRAAEDAFTEFKSQNNVTSLLPEIALTQRLLEQLRLERDQRMLEEPTLITVDTLIEERQKELDRLVLLQPTYNVLDENAQEARSKYQHILNKYTEAELKAAVVQAANFIQIVHLAQEPLQPENNLKIFLVLGIVGSLGLGILLAFLFEYVTGLADDTLRVDDSDTQTVMGLPLLGSVPNMKGGHCEPNTPEAEKIRQLRTQALLLSPGGRLKTLLVTSPQPGDGKTVVTANLGVALADGESHIVLVDADLRNPALHEWFDQPNLDGLADLLEADEGRLEKIAPQLLRDTRVPGLSLLTAGNMPQDPSLLLTSPNFIALLELLSDQFDLVLLDSPPVLSAPDTTILAGLVEGALFVLSPNTTSRMAARQAIENLNSRDNIHVIGVALNRISLDDYAYRYYAHREERTGVLERALSHLPVIGRPTEPNLHSVAQMARILGVRSSTIRRWCQDGRLPAFKRGINWWVRGDELQDVSLDLLVTGVQPENPAMNSLEGGAIPESPEYPAAGTIRNSVPPKPREETSVELPDAEDVAPAV